MSAEQSVERAALRDEMIRLLDETYAAGRRAEQAPPTSPTDLWVSERFSAAMDAVHRATAGRARASEHEIASATLAVVWEALCGRSIDAVSATGIRGLCEGLGLENLPHQGSGREEGGAPRCAHLAPLHALVAEWEAASRKTMPERGPSETERDQGIRVGFWRAARMALGDLREALGLPRTPPDQRCVNGGDR